MDSRIVLNPKNGVVKIDDDDGKKLLVNTI